VERSQSPIGAPPSDSWADVPIRPQLCDSGGAHDPERKPPELTQRELEVVQLLRGGATNFEISQRLLISPKTTKNHLASIYQKLGATNRTQALSLAVAMGLVDI